MAFDEEDLPEEVETDEEETRGEEEEAEEDIDPMEAFALLEILEEGTGSTVFQAKHKTNGKLYAIKVLEFGEAVNQAYATLEQEVAQLIELSQASPSVLGYVALCRRETSLWIVEEFCDGGSAIDAAILLEALSEDQIRAILYGAIQALLRLHEEGFIHGNLRASNVLLQSDGAIKVADFGQLGLLKRSTYWLSPEYIEDKESITDRSDVWSLGITCMELAEHVTPYHNMTPEASTELVLTGPSPELETKAEWSTEFNSFIARCLVRNPNERPSPSELLQHPFLAQVTEAKVTATVQDMCKQFKQKREMWNDWAREQAKGTGQQVLLLPLCQIKELFYKRLSGEEDDEPTGEEDEEEGDRSAATTAEEGLSVTLEDLTGEKVVKGPGECTGGRCELRGLIECEVYLLDWVRAVRLEDCSDCTVVVGACKGEVVASKCDQLQLSCAAQRVRLEACTECNAFLCVMDGPVVAASHSILVGPWNTAYSGAVQAFRSAGIDTDPSKNCYQQVLDLSRNDPAVPTPHFSILEAADVQPQTVEVPGSQALVENPCAAGAITAPAASSAEPAVRTEATGGSRPPSRGSAGGGGLDDYDEDFDAPDADHGTKENDASVEPELQPPRPGAKPPKPRALLSHDDDFDGEDEPADEPKQQYSDDEFEDPTPHAPANAEQVRQDGETVVQAVVAVESPKATPEAKEEDGESSSDDDEFPTIAAPRTTPAVPTFAAKAKALANFTDEFAEEPSLGAAAVGPSTASDDDDSEFDVDIPLAPQSPPEPQVSTIAARTLGEPTGDATPTIEVTEATANEPDGYDEDFDTPPAPTERRKASVASQASSSGHPTKSEESAPVEEVYDDEFDESPDEEVRQQLGLPAPPPLEEGPVRKLAGGGFDSESEDEPEAAVPQPPPADPGATGDEHGNLTQGTKPTGARATRLESDPEASSSDDDKNRVPSPLASPTVPGSGPVNRGPTIARLRGEQVTRLAGSVTGDALRVLSLTECEVYLLDTLRNALVEDCHGCTVVVGPTAETVCIRNCSGCSITAAATQVLVEQCAELSLQLYSAQRPVLTASTGIRINTWHCAFSGCTDLFSAARLQPAANCFADVKADAASQFVVESPARLKPCELEFGEDEFMENSSPDMPEALRTLLQTAGEETEAPAPAEAVLPSDEKLCYVKGKTHRTIVRANGLDEQQMALDSLQHCAVKLFGPLDSVLVDDCTDCTFLIGPTTGSVMFRDCARLVVTCACQQLRTRDCQDVQLFLYCRTDPIVESSTDVRFQTWNVAYPGLTALFHKVGFAPEKNRYRNVFDFNKEDDRYPEPHFVVQPIDGSLQLRQEFITDFQDRKVEAGEPDIPEPLLLMLKGQLAAPMGRPAEEEGGLSHLDIRTGQAAAQELLEEEEKPPLPPRPLVLPKEALHDEQIELDDLDEDVGSEAGSEKSDPPPAVPSRGEAEYVPAFAMATPEYRANVERARQLERRLQELREAVGAKAQKVEQLLRSLALL